MKPLITAILMAIMIAVVGFSASACPTKEKPLRCYKLIKKDKCGKCLYEKRYVPCTPCICEGDFLAVKLRYTGTSVAKVSVWAQNGHYIYHRWLRPGKQFIVRRNDAGSLGKILKLKVQCKTTTVIHLKCGKIHVSSPINGPFEVDGFFTSKGGWWKHCPKPEDSGVSDSFVGQDAGVPDQDMGYDSGTTDLDSGTTDLDSGTTDLDSGTTNYDSGSVLHDASILPKSDSGNISKQDLGSPPKQLDAGRQPDSGCDCPPDNGDEFELVGGGCSIVGTDSFSGCLTFGILLLFGLLISSRKRLASILGGLFIVTILFFSTIPAQADGLQLNVPGLQPTPLSSGYYVNDSADVMSHGSLRFKMLFDYARRPLALQKASNGEIVDTVVKGRSDLNLLFSLGLLDRLELGLSIPITLGQDDGNLSIIGRSEDLEGGLGNIQLASKFLIVKVVSGKLSGALSLAASLTLPSGRKTHLIGMNGKEVEFSPKLLYSIKYTYFDATMNLGILVRNPRSVQFRQQSVDFDTIELVGGIGLRIPLWKNRLDAIGDISAAASTTSDDPEARGAEFLGGLRAYLPFGLTADVGAGGGVGRGIGTSKWRVLAGIGWSWDEPKQSPCPTPTPIVKKVPVVRTKKVLVPVSIILKEIYFPPVYFATNKDIVLPQSLSTLDKVVEVLKANPQVRRVMVEGHTDHRASDAYNMDLSRRRAQSVYRYLVKAGVKADRLEHVGYGESYRLDTTKTKAGMAKNRRVEFVIVDPKSGVIIKRIKSMVQ